MGLGVKKIIGNKHCILRLSIIFYRTILYLKLIKNLKI
jgi:hypothetical protein